MQEPHNRLDNPNLASTVISTSAASSLACLQISPESAASEAKTSSAHTQIVWMMGRYLNIGMMNLVIAGLTLIVAICATVYSARSYYIARATAEAQLFVQLRQRYYEVQERLPRDAAILERGPDIGVDDWLKFRAYWEQAYTEWHITTKLNDGQFIRLWNNYYEPVLRRVITRPAFRDTAADLFDYNFIQGPRKDFADLFRRFHREETGVELRRGMVNDGRPAQIPIRRAHG